MSIDSRAVTASRLADVDEGVVRAEVSEWLASNWNPDDELADWRQRLVESGWARPTWPVEWFGLCLPAGSEQVVAEEFEAVGAAGTPINGAMLLASRAILDFGPDEMRARYLRGLLTGEETWCQLFSEPDAGSDLASLKTSAVLDGDSYRINGQKLWSTSAHHAHLAMVLARTDPAVPKHQGITFLVVPVRQPGVEVRPLRQMNGYSSFNEVFFTNAETPRDNVIGEVGGGWRVAVSVLANERQLGALKRPVHRPDDGRANAQARAEAAAWFETYIWYPQRAGRVDLVIEHARLAGRSEDPVIRQEIARLLSMQRILEWTAERAAAAPPAPGAPPNPTGSIQKLMLSHIARQALRVHSMLAGSCGMLAGPSSRFDGLLAEILVSVPAQSIAGGTDEIQRNVIAERVLGLPRSGV